MRYTRFGRTDLEVSRVCFGTWQFGGEWGSTEERDLVDAIRRALELGIDVLVYGPMAHGLLSGKMTPDQEFAEDDWRGQSDLFQGENFRTNLEKVEELKKFAEEQGHSVAQLAVAWTLANLAVDVAIVGARRPDHIEGTAPAAEFDLSQDDLWEIEDIMQGAAMVGGPSPERG
jgi:aryl-alcohol dehydrogenase-like predicted oxidoreductase